jgi:hypothetical protein
MTDLALPLNALNRIFQEDAQGGAVKKALSRFAWVLICEG